MNNHSQWRISTPEHDPFGWCRYELDVDVPSEPTSIATGDHLRGPARRTRFVLIKPEQRTCRIAVVCIDEDCADLIFQKVEPLVIGTQNWTKCAVEFDIPFEANIMDIWVFIDGPGELYVGA